MQIVSRFRRKSEQLALTLCSNKKIKYNEYFSEKQNFVSIFWKSILIFIKDEIYRCYFPFIKQYLNTIEWLSKKKYHKLAIWKVTWNALQINTITCKKLAIFATWPHNNVKKNLRRVKLLFFSRNNCCEFVTSYYASFQMFIKSYFKRPVFGAPLSL